MNACLSRAAARIAALCLIAHRFAWPADAMAETKEFSFDSVGTVALRRPLPAFVGSPDALARLSLPATRDPVWQTTAGDGFRKHAIDAGFGMGAGFGVRIFGGEEVHDIAMGTIHMGTMISGLVAAHHW